MASRNLEVSAVPQPSSKYADDGAGIHHRLTPDSTHLVEPLYDINEHCIDLLVSAARQPQDPNTSATDLIHHLRPILHALTPKARARAANTPFLLVDMNFRDREWWRNVASHPNKMWRAPTWLPCFPRQPSIKLARATLIAAWYAARTDRATAMVALGLAPAVSEVIADLRLHEIDCIAERHFRFIRPRWEDRPAVWKNLLHAAQSGDARSNSDFILHGLQLLAGDLIPHCDSAPPKK